MLPAYLLGASQAGQILNQGFAMHPLRELRESGPHTVAQVEALLAENVVFHSPIFVKAVTGRELVAKVLAASAPVRSGRYTAEYMLAEHITMLRWTGEIQGRKVESLEVIEDNAEGLVIERTLAFRPLPAIELFRDAIYPVLRDELPASFWRYQDA